MAEVDCSCLVTKDSLIFTGANIWDFLEILITYSFTELIIVAAVIVTQATTTITTTITIAITITIIVARDQKANHFFRIFFPCFILLYKSQLKMLMGQYLPSLFRYEETALKYQF